MRIVSLHHILLAMQLLKVEYDWNVNEKWMIIGWLLSDYWIQHGTIDKKPFALVHKATEMYPLIARILIGIVSLHMDENCIYRAETEGFRCPEFRECDNDDRTALQMQWSKWNWMIQFRLGSKLIQIRRCDQLPCDLYLMHLNADKSASELLIS